MTSRLVTPQLAEQFKQYPLYSQDGKKKDGKSVNPAILFTANSSPL